MKRNNPNKIGYVIGTVVQINPIKVSVLDGHAFFSGDKLTIGDRLKGYTEVVTMSINDGENVTATITHSGLQINDKVICQFTDDNQNLIVIDKVS
nr:DUF2577 domain-containing protein [Clostridium autoethanogenum]